jgi:hypothetical protein
MVLTQDEQATLNALGSNKKNFEVIAKFFIRPFESLPLEYKNVPNDQLGEIIKSQLLAKEHNLRFLADMKASVASDIAEPTPIAPA